jgi:hypothetical protein
MSKTDSQNLQDMAITLRSLNDVIGGTQKEVNNEQANNTHSIASRLNTFMRENTRRLDRIAQMLSWLEIMDSTKVMIGGIWSTTKGILRSINGMRNLSGKPSNKFGTGGYHGGHQGGKKGGNTRGGTGGKKGGTRGGGGARGGAGSSWKTASIGGKGLASGLKSGLAVGAVSTVAHLGYAAVTDQDMLQATRESGVSLAGSIVGGLIGSLIPGGTAIGAMIGGMAAEAINAVITNESQKVRSATRDAIYNELSATLPSIATLFSGPNALAGDYRKGQLEDLKKALEDKTLSKGEVSESLIDKLRENGDLDRLDAAGIKFESIEMAEGGYLNDALRSQKKYHARPKHNTTSKLMSDGGPLVGPSHKQGGMAIEGTNIEVEGGEYVVSKNNVKPNAQVLEAINDGAVVKPIFPEDIHNNITQAVSKEYLGKQMQVYNTNNIITNNDNTQVVGKEPLGKQMQVYNTNNIITNNNNSVSGNQKIEISPVSLDLSGTIKLDLNGKETDITQELLKDEVFIRNIANFISQRFNQYNYGGFNKGNFLQKFSV